MWCENMQGNFYGLPYTRITLSYSHFGEANRCVSFI